MGGAGRCRAHGDAFRCPGVGQRGRTGLEQAAFRPANLVWRVWGLRLFLAGRSDWGVQVRKGLGTVNATRAEA